MLVLPPVAPHSRVTPPCHFFVACTPASLSLVFPGLCFPSLPCLHLPAFLALKGGSAPLLTPPRFPRRLLPCRLSTWTFRLQLREQFRSDLLVLRLHSDRVAPHWLSHGGCSYLHDPCDCSPFSVAVWGPVGNASVFRVWDSRAFVRDTSVNKLYSQAIPCVFLGFPPDAPSWQFYHPTSRRVFSSQDITFDESVPFYRLFPYRSAPPPPPPLFFAPDPLPGFVPLKVAVNSGAAQGAASGGAASRGAEPRGVESEGAESGGAEPGGEEPGGAEPGGAEPASVERGGAKPERVEPGGAESESKGWLLWEPRKGVLFDSKDVNFVEGLMYGGWKKLPEAKVSQEMKQITMQLDLTPIVKEEGEEAAAEGGDGEKVQEALAGGGGGVEASGSTSGAAGPEGEQQQGKAKAPTLPQRRKPKGVVMKGWETLVAHHDFFSALPEARIAPFPKRTSRPALIWPVADTRAQTWVLQRFGFTYSSPQSTPLPTGHWLSGPPSDESVEPSGPYAELVGCLITSGMGLVLGGWTRVVLTGHADASWVDDLATQRSSQGYTFSLGSGSVSWRFTRSSSVLSSSCEVEIYAGAMAAEDLRWLTYLLTDLGEAPRSPPVMYVDNKAMLALCQEHRLEHRTKHIALCYFLARELQQRGQLRLVYIVSQANSGDVFTKALQPCDHQQFCTVLGLEPTVHHLLTS
ncbi:unnamed protein product [Closterium sp. NIES-53]